MNRCWRKGAVGDALNAVLSAAGYNLRWLLRAVLAGTIKAFYFARILWAAIKTIGAPLTSKINTRLVGWIYRGGLAGRGGCLGRFVVV